MAVYVQYDYKSLLKLSVDNFLGLENQIGYVRRMRTADGARATAMGRSSKAFDFAERYEE